MVARSVASSLGLLVGLGGPPAVLHWVYQPMRRVAIAFILAISIGAPIAETFDRWDHTYQDGNDTEATLVVVSLCIGAALSVTGNVMADLGPGPAVARTFPPPEVVRHVVGAQLTRPAPTISPPTPLRV